MPIINSPSERTNGKKDIMTVAGMYFSFKKKCTAITKSKAEKCSVKPEKISVKYIEQVAKIRMASNAFGICSFLAIL